MSIHKLLHDIVTELPIHAGRKAELHEQITAETPDDEKESDDGKDARAGSSNSPSGK
jgi:hypothetical protein